MSTSTDYAALTTSLLNHHDELSPALFYDDYVKDLLETLFDPALPDDQMTFLSIVLSVKTHDIATAKNFDVNADDLQLVYDLAETGTKCSAALKVAKQEQEHVIVRGEEGKNQIDALRLFLDEVEKVGEAMVADMRRSGQDADGEEVSD